MTRLSFVLAMAAALACPTADAQQVLELPAEDRFLTAGLEEVMRIGKGGPEWEALVDVTGVAFDVAGNLFIADLTFNDLRILVDRSGELVAPLVAARLATNRLSLPGPHRARIVGEPSVLPTRWPAERPLAEGRRGAQPQDRSQPTQLAAEPGRGRTRDTRGGCPATGDGALTGRTTGPGVAMTAAPGPASIRPFQLTRLTKVTACSEKVAGRSEPSPSGFAGSKSTRKRSGPCSSTIP